MEYRIQKKMFGSSVEVFYDCPSCGEKLASPQGEVGQTHACPACSREFVVPGPDLASLLHASPPDRPWSARSLLVVGVGFFLLMFASVATRDLTRRFLRGPAWWEQDQIAEEPQPVALPLPPTGLLSSDRRTGVAPLEIRTRAGDGNYYVKIVRIDNVSRIVDKDHPIRTAFIRDGETLHMAMPLGDYEIRYATGSQWYGSVRRFGPNAAHAKADDVFTFRETPQGYSGFTVELIMQVNGNLNTKRLSAEEF